MDQGLRYPTTEELLEQTGEAVMAALPFATSLLCHADEALAAIGGPAAQATLLARAEQIAVRGHTAESDDDLPIGKLGRDAKSYLSAALDVIDGTLEHRNLAVGRRRLARAAALCLAEYDRLTRFEAAATKRGRAA